MMTTSAICCYPVLNDNSSSGFKGSPHEGHELRGPLDILGRNFRTYLEEHADQEELFMRAWSEGSVQDILQIVQAFFEGLPDFTELREPVWAYYDDRPLRTYGVTIHPTEHSHDLMVYHSPLGGRDSLLGPRGLRWGRAVTPR